MRLHATHEPKKKNVFQNFHRTHSLTFTSSLTNIIFQCEIYIIKSYRRHLFLSFSVFLLLFFSWLFVFFPYAAQVLALDRIIQEIIRIITTTTTTIIIISMVKEMVTAVNRSIQIKYLAVQMVDHHNRTNHGKIYQFLHQIQHLVMVNSHNNLAAASFRRHQTIRLMEIHIQTVSLQTVSLLKFRLPLVYPHRILRIISIQDQQHINQVYWINFCTTNKADDEMPLQQCMLIGNNLHTLSFLAFLMFWLDSY